MDHLQQDIDSLETERGALRDKLKLYAKRGGTHHGMFAFSSEILKTLLTLFMSDANVLLIIELAYCRLLFDITCVDYMSKFNGW